MHGHNEPRINDIARQAATLDHSTSPGFHPLSPASGSPKPSLHRGSPQTGYFLRRRVLSGGRDQDGVSGQDAAGQERPLYARRAGYHGYHTRRRPVGVSISSTHTFKPIRWTLRMISPGGRSPDCTGRTGRHPNRALCSIWPETRLRDQQCGTAGPGRSRNAHPRCVRFLRGVLLPARSATTR